MPLLEIRDLCVERDGRQVLVVERLQVQRGETVAVVGPNGAGKSTLLLALARLIRPKTGQIFFNNQPTDHESDLTYRRRIALVLQDPLLFDMTVFDNIASGLRFRRIDKQQISATVDLWLDRLGISALRDRRATDLSGGEAQRVALARAFVLEPELLLLDEPFSALDPPTRRRLVARLSTLLAETNTTTLLITHDMNEAVQIGQKIAFVLDGKLRQTLASDALDKVSADVMAFLQA